MKLYEEIEKSFPMLEKLFEEKDLEIFKNEKISDLCFYHFGIGLWIRNNMLYPEESNLYSLFLEHGIGDIDEMSSFIIRLFHYYISKKF